MERRNALKLMIASMTAPAYIANGLMRVKPVIVPETVDIWDVYSDDGFHYTYGANGSVLLRKSRFHFMPMPILPMPIHTPLYDIISETSEDMDATRLQLYFKGV